MRKPPLFQCYEDVGGTDIRVSAKFNEDAQWWVGWHTSKGLDSWFRTKPSKWRLIGWELWGHEAEWPHVICHNVPDPSTTPLHEPKVPTSSWHATYDANGVLEHSWEEGPMPIDVDANDMWPKGAAKGKGRGMGQWKGKG